MNDYPNLGVRIISEISELCQYDLEEKNIEGISVAKPGIGNTPARINLQTPSLLSAKIERAAGLASLDSSCQGPSLTRHHYHRS